MDSDVGHPEHKGEQEGAESQNEAGGCLRNPHRDVVNSYKEALSQQLDNEDELDQRVSEPGGKFVISYFPSGKGS